MAKVWRRDERRDEGNASEVASRAVSVGDDVVGCGGATGVTLRAVRDPFDGDFVLRDRPIAAGQNELGTRSCGGWGFRWMVLHGGIGLWR